MSLRLAELVTALSLATDLGSGVPMEMMLATCVVSLRLGVALGLSDDELRQIYYLALLRHAGCTAESHHAAELVGNELATTRAFFSMNPSQPMQMMGVMWREVVNPQQPTLQRFGLANFRRSTMIVNKTSLTHWYKQEEEDRWVGLGAL